MTNIEMLKVGEAYWFILEFYGLLGISLILPLKHLPLEKMTEG